MLFLMPANGLNSSVNRSGPVLRASAGRTLFIWPCRTQSGAEYGVAKGVGVPATCFSRKGEGQGTRVWPRSGKQVHNPSHASRQQRLSQGRITTGWPISVALRTAGESAQ